MIYEVIFDIETKKLFSDIATDDPADLGISVVSLYSRTLDSNLKEIEGEISSYWEKDFDKMWAHFQKANRIIGFNSLNFDVPALEPLAPFSFKSLPHFDIMDEIKAVIGRRIGLNIIAKDTLGKAKSDVGTNAVIYWQKGDKESLAKLQKYCMDDVIITKEVYDYALHQGKLKYTDKWNNPREIEINFSYPKEEIAQKQDSLF